MGLPLVTVVMALLYPQLLPVLLRLSSLTNTFSQFTPLHMNYMSQE